MTHGSVRENCECTAVIFHIRPWQCSAFSALLSQGAVRQWNTWDLPEIRPQMNNSLHSLVLSNPLSPLILPTTQRKEKYVFLFCKWKSGGLLTCLRSQNCRGEDPVLAFRSPRSHPTEPSGLQAPWESEIPENPAWSSSKEPLWDSSLTGSVPSLQCLSDPSSELPSTPKPTPQLGIKCYSCREFIPSRRMYWMNASYKPSIMLAIEY